MGALKSYVLMIRWMATKREKEMEMENEDKENEADRERETERQRMILQGNVIFDPDVFLYPLPFLLRTLPV